jgi:hypothetical protein
MSLGSETISAEIHFYIIEQAKINNVPPSVANWLQVEETGNWKTGAWGASIRSRVPSREGYYSYGIFQIYMEPSNIEDLLKNYWWTFGETETFDVMNPYHNTRLAMRYLAGLHRQFRTWYLACCGYGWGPGNMERIRPSWSNIPLDVQAYATRIISARCPQDDVPEFADLPEAFRAAARVAWMNDARSGE